MEIGFENKVVNTYREISHQVKRIQESAESVVPDVNDDIGRIASIQTSVLLKSKDLNSHGVTVTGEASAVLLYITEGDSSVSYVRVTKSFTMDYEIGEIEADVVSQINLQVTNAEARVLNPRKVSVTLELAGELSCYRPEAMNVETLIPEGKCEGLHARFEETEAIIANAVCEKTFAVNEQYSFPGGKPVPAQLVSQNVDFCISEKQHIGSKIIIKGTVDISVCYLSNEVNYPLSVNFSSPFSQIIDTGEENMDNCTAMIELTSAFYEMIETINGEKAMDAELHAVVQIVSRCKRTVRYISDAYSNAMPAKCSVQASQINIISNVLRAKLSSDERINIADDCNDVLSVFAAVSQISTTDGKLSASVSLDVFYRTKDGSLSAAKRQINMEGEFMEAPARIIHTRLSDIYLRPDGAAIDSHLSVEISYQSCTNMELSRVTAVSLDEENSYDQTAFPTVTLVRTDSESIWELAKRYHSSTEGIGALNNLEDGISGKLLLVPKEI